MVSYNDWVVTLEERVKKLNLSTASRIFEVGSSQKLINFEIGGAFGPEEMQEILDGSADPDYYGVIRNVKPGLWVVSEGENREEPPFTATWVSDAHINYDALPEEPLVSPLNLDGAEWKKVHDGYHNSTVGCVFSFEAAQAFEEVGIDLALDGFAELGGVVPGGFVYGPHESGFEIYAREQNSQVVQIKVCWEYP